MHERFVVGLSDIVGNFLEMLVHHLLQPFVEAIAILVQHHVVGISGTAVTGIE